MIHAGHHISSAYVPDSVLAENLHLPIVEIKSLVVKVETFAWTGSDLYGTRELFNDEGKYNLPFSMITEDLEDDYTETSLVLETAGTPYPLYIGNGGARQLGLFHHYNPTNTAFDVLYGTNSFVGGIYDLWIAGSHADALGYLPRVSSSTTVGAVTVVGIVTDQGLLGEYL